MPLVFKERPSDSPFIEKVWYAQSDSDNSFIAPAQARLEMVFTKRGRHSHVSFWGAATQAEVVNCPAEAEFIGIQYP